MPQLHFYVPDTIANEIKRRSKSRGISVSRYLADLVKTEINPGWPQGYTDQVLGCWCGEPLAREYEGDLEQRGGM